MKNFLWILGIAVVFIGLMVWAKGSDNPNLPQFDVNVINSYDHTKGGSASSTAVLLEYADFQCPACKTYYPVVRQIEQEFSSQVTFVYRYFPLINIHQNAEFSARAAEAAAKQGKFWEMHDLLFEKQDEWATIPSPYATFESYAKLLELDLAKFKTDYNSNEVKDIVKAERQHALKIGLQGTPSFFVNGKQIQNPNSIEEFRALLRAAIGTTTAAVATSTKQ